MDKFLKDVMQKPVKYWRIATAGKRESSTISHQSGDELTILDGCMCVTRGGVVLAATRGSIILVN